jgi:rSAM/selenodomain-associated transferase 2
LSLHSPSVSVVIPTLNEEHCLPALLDDLVSERPNEIIVADGNSADRTAGIATPRARVVTVAANRGAQMNAGAAIATGDVLLFLHADVRLNGGAIEALRRTMSAPEVIGGNFDIRYDGGGFAAALFTEINRWRRRLGVFYGDSGIFCRRSIFAALGGYQPWPVLEDYEFARRLWKRGKLALLPEPIWVSSRRWRRAGVWRTIWRWFSIQTLYSAGVSPHRLAGNYRHIR